MRKSILFILTLSLIFSFTACGKEFKAEDIKISTDEICTYKNNTDYDILYLAVEYSDEDSYEEEEYSDEETSDIWSDGIYQNVAAGAKSKGAYIYKGVDRIKEPLDDSVKPAKLHITYRDGDSAVNIDYDVQSKEKTSNNTWKIGEWKDEYEKLMPKINAELFYMPLNDEYTLNTLVYDVEKDSYNDYVKSVKKFGYTKDPIEFKSGGIFGYSYSAKNKDGKEILVSWNDGWKSMEISCEK